LNKYAIFTVACVALFANSISVAKAQEIHTPMKNLILTEFEKSGGTVSYLGRAYGMDGWILINEKKEIQYVYTNDDGATVMGMLFSPNGSAETITQIQKFKIANLGSQDAITNLDPQSTDKAEVIYKNFSNSSWIELGDKNVPYFYSVITVDSAEAKVFLDKLMPYIDSKKMTVRLIPIATSEANFYDAAAILSADDPAATLISYMNGDKSIIKNISVKDESLNKLDVNAMFAKNSAIKGIPLNVYRRPADGKIVAISGAPENMMLLAADLQPKIVPNLDLPVAKPAEEPKTDIAEPVKAEPKKIDAKKVETKKSTDNNLTDEEKEVSPAEAIKENIKEDKKAKGK